MSERLGKSRGESTSGHSRPKPGLFFLLRPSRGTTLYTHHPLTHSFCLYLLFTSPVRPRLSHLFHVLEILILAPILPVHDLVHHDHLSEVAPASSSEAGSWGCSSRCQPLGQGPPRCTLLACDLHPRGCLGRHCHWVRRDLCPRGSSRSRLRRREAGEASWFADPLRWGRRVHRVRDRAVH